MLPKNTNPNTIYVCRWRGEYLVFPDGKGTTGYPAKCLWEQETAPGKWFTRLEWQGITMDGVVYESRGD